MNDSMDELHIDSLSKFIPEFLFIAIKATTSSEIILRQFVLLK